MTWSTGLAQLRLWVTQIPVWIVSRWSDAIEAPRSPAVESWCLLLNTRAIVTDAGPKLTARVAVRIRSNRHLSTRGGIRLIGEERTRLRA